MSRPLVSVVTGTWNRHELLLEAIENVRQQTYRPLEHVIVSDGPDDELHEIWENGDLGDEYGEVPVRFVELGRHWTGFCPDSFAAAAFKTAQFLARGEYQMWLADDERMLVTDYVERMVAKLEEGYDFAYSTVRMSWAEGRGKRGQAWDMGGPEPKSGNITSVFYRSELMRHRMFELHIGTATDWDQIDHWMKAGATWAWIPETLFSHVIHQ
jgi:GT2 family glycosyltransferase